MRTHKHEILTVLAALGLLAGCASDVGDTGSTLRAVDADALTSETLYLASDVSQIPFTATELAAQGIEVDATIPIRVELIENYAVAWFAPDGEPIISRDTIVAIWTVVQRPQAGRLEGGSDAPIAEPDDNTIDTVINTDAYVTLPEGRTIVTEFGVTGAEQTILDFLDRLGTPHEIPALAQLETYHPGCL